MASASPAIRKALKRRDVRMMKKLLQVESGQVVRDDGNRLVQIVMAFIAANP